MAAPGLKKVAPYWHPYATMAKSRWWGREILELVSTEFRDRSIEYYRYAIESGVCCVNSKPAKIGTIIKNGDRIENIVHRHEPPVTSIPVKVMHVDHEKELIVIDKPGSIPVHAVGRYYKNSLVEILQTDFGFNKVYPVNRLDRLTSGCMIMALSPIRARQMCDEFLAGGVKKEYIARCRGEFSEEDVICELPLLTVDRQMGLNIVHPEGKPAKTAFKRLFYDTKTHTSVLHCRPFTGRSHQIRVHLQYLGFPIANDPIYSNTEAFGSKLGTGGIDITPSLERQPPTIPPKPSPQASDITTPPLLTNNEEAVDVLNGETTRALLPRETGEDIGFASPIPLSAEAVKIVMALRNMKDGDEDWGRWRDNVFKGKKPLVPPLPLGAWSNKPSVNAAAIEARKAALDEALGNSESTEVPTIRPSEEGDTVEVIKGELYCKECYLPLHPDPPADYSGQTLATIRTLPSRAWNWLETVYMSSENFQITIPTLDDGDDSTAQFGRMANYGGFDSPTPTFGSFGQGNSSRFHSRVDSNASADSFNSYQFVGSSTPTLVNKPTPGAGAHSANPSTTNSFPLPRKGSFASIRSAFKTGKADAEVPPVPQLTEPFSSQSSLPPRERSRQTSISSVHHSKGSASKTNRAGFARQASQSGSFFQSENGSNPSISIPPVPRRPGFPRHRTTVSNVTQERGANTPSDYALSVVFHRFVTSAEALIETFLQKSLQEEPSLPDYLGPGVDKEFDGLLDSLGRIAQRHTNAVIDCITRWRRTQNEPVSLSVVGTTLSNTPSGRSYTGIEAGRILGERKSLAAIYLTCRALTVVLGSIHKNALDETMGGLLEETIFEQFRHPDVKLLSHSPNARANADLYTTLLGQLSHVRFESVTDRFLRELKPIRETKVKEDDGRYETLLKGLKRVHIKVWPPEAFEEATDFMSEFAQCFSDAHGLKLKTAFAESLTHLLHPLSKTAQDELNHPGWAKSISIIHRKASEMLTKRQYWHVAFPLAVTALCVAPHEFFLQNWIAHVNASISKLKETRSRPYALNGIVRLVWTYLFRCRESASVSVEKLESILRSVLPPNRSFSYTANESLEPFVCLVHFIAYRHGEFGRSFILKLLQESAMTSSGNTVTQSELLAPDRMMIGIRATLLYLNAIEKDMPPTWPSSSDFNSLKYGDDYQFGATFLPDLFYAKPDMQEFHDRYGPVINRIANICGATVGSLFVFDEKFTEQAAYTSIEDRDLLTARTHGDYTVWFRRDLVPQIDLLRTVFESWPRCLHSSIPLADMLDFLIRGVIHVEPSMGQVAAAALKRTAQDSRHSKAVMSRFTNFLFSAEHVEKEGGGTHLVVENNTILFLWEFMVKEWSKSLNAHSQEQEPLPLGMDSDIDSKISTEEVIDSIEAGALFLLTYNQKRIRAVGTRILKLLGKVILAMEGVSASEAATSEHPISISWVLNLFQGKNLPVGFLEDSDNALDAKTKDRLTWWRENTAKDKIQRLAEGTDDRDQRIWAFVMPAFIRVGLDQQPAVIGLFKDALSSAVVRFHPLIASLAGIGGKGPVTAPARSPMPYRQNTPREPPRDRIDEHRMIIGQWQTWLSMLCATAVESRVTFVREHTRAHSELQSLRERLYSPKGLFRTVIPFLASENGIFRSAVVTALSCIHPTAFKSLLEYLKGITEHARTNSQDRLHTAVAQVYQLTAHFIKYPRALEDPTALTLLLGFVRATTQFLRNPSTREDLELQRLRRFFCGVVENLFDGLSAVGEEDSQRWLSENQRLSLYRLCEEWCLYGMDSNRTRRRLGSESASGSQFYFIETEQLSAAAAGAMAALCRGAFFSDNMSSSSPMERLEPLSVTETLGRIGAMLAAPNATVNESGRKALRSLLNYKTRHDGLIDSTLRCSYVTAADVGASQARFFEVVASVMMTPGNTHFSFEQIACLGLSNLCQRLVETRRLAFNLLEHLHSQTNGATSLGPFESAIGSLAASVYLPAQRRISQILAAEHSEMSGPVLSECSLRMPQVYDDTTSSQLAVHPHVLRFLEPWISSIRLMNQGNAEIAWEGQRALYNLLSLTIRYGDLYPDQIQAIWERLATQPSSRNDTLTVKFLIEQASRRGNPTFITAARRVIACLSRTSTGRLMFRELCNLIEPESMLPMQERNPSLPNLHDAGFIAELESVFTPPNEVRERQALGTGQLALLFMGDIALERAWEIGVQLPVLLHTIFVHLDHQSPYVQVQAKNLLFQTLRSLTPGLEDSPVMLLLPSRPQVKASIDALSKDSRTLLWKPDEGAEQVGPKMERLSHDVLALLVPLYPQLRQDWGVLALDWGTTCPIRSIAFRSLQLFRVLMPQINRAQLANMIGRITNTISEPEKNIQAFTREMLVTFSAIAKSEIDPALLPPIFWCACACLSTTMEMEFLTVLGLVDTLLQRLDLNDAATVDSLRAHRPPKWTGPDPNLQAMVIVGLRSSVTYEASFALLAKLAKVSGGWLIDESPNRVRELFTVALPSCLYMKDGGEVQGDLNSFAMDIARLAERHNSGSIARLSKSFAKGIIRTREDLIRQGVACIRDEFGSQAVSLLLGLICNSERWLKTKSMEILKVLFQHPQSRMPLARSELLNPLLRLLSTDLAPQALEVLDEPLAIAAGPSPAHAFRMSMAGVELSRDEISEGSASHFNMAPSESGWSIPHSEELVAACRENTLAVFDTCKPNNRPSVINFEPETRSRLAVTSSFFSLENPTSLGDLVSTLNELNDFFQKDGVDSFPNGGRRAADNQAAYNRATEILSRSLGRTSGSRAAPSSGGDARQRPSNLSNGGLNAPSLENDQPPTPFVGLFSVGAPSHTHTRGQESMDTLNHNFLRSTDETGSFETTEQPYNFAVPSRGFSMRAHHASPHRAFSNGSNFREVDSGSDTDEDPYALDALGR